MVRPVKPALERKQNVLRIRLTDEERAALERAANGKTSTWARRLLLEAARESVSGISQRDHLNDRQASQS